MEKDHGEAQVGKLVNWVTERGPQQLHACDDHQEDVPAVEKERKEAITWQPIPYQGSDKGSRFLRVYCALSALQKAKMVGPLLSSLYRGGNCV